MLEHLSQTALILWVAESDWGYPIVLTLHSIGMALVVGILAMFDLRILGFAPSLPRPAFARFFPVAWTGLAINAISGALLFCANYSVFLNNTAFVTKLLLLLIAAIATVVLARRIESGLPPAIERALAFSCLLLWLGAIVAGRIIGYTSVPE